jgi:DNA-binding transcriptional LysR family regulator
LELRHLRCAVAVAEEGSFTKAATGLHLVQQALSQQIADLERELGVQLFERSARGTRLTPAGVVFVEEARGVLAHVERTIGRIRGGAGATRPTLKVAAGRSFRAAQQIVADTIGRYHATEPAVEIDLIELATPGKPEALLNGHVDVAFAHSLPETTDLVEGELVWQEPWNAVLLPARHRLARQQPLWLRDLAELPMVAMPWELDPVLTGRIAGALADRGLTPTIAPVRLAGFAELALKWVADGLGWCLMVPSARDEFRGAPGVVFRCFADEPFSRLGLWILWRRGDRSILVQRFLAAARAVRQVREADGQLVPPGGDVGTAVRDPRLTRQADRGA